MSRTRKNISIYWLASFLSTVSTHLLLLLMSTEVFLHTKSNTKGSLIYAFTMILPFFCVSLTHNIVKRRNLHIILSVTTLFQALLSLCLTMNDQTSIFLIYFILCIKGYLDSVEKSGRVILLKNIIPKESIESASTIMGLSTYLGMGAGASLGSYLHGYFSIGELGVSSGILACISGILYFTLNASDKTTPCQEPMSWRDFLTNLRTLNLLGSFFALTFTVAIFQGIHNVSRSAYGIEFLKLGPSGISEIQLTATLGVLGGAFFVSRFMLSHQKLSKVSPNLLVLLTGISLPCLTMAQNHYMGHSLYFLFIFMFEISFTRIQNIIIKDCPGNLSSGIFSRVYAIIPVALSLMIFMMGYVIDEYGINFTYRTICILSVLFYLSNKTPLVYHAHKPQ